MRDFKQNPLRPKERVLYEDLYELYIGQNLSVNEVATIVGRSVPAIEKTLKLYGIKKDKELVGKARSRGLKNKTQEEIAEIVAKRKQTNLLKYGVGSALQNKTVKEKMMNTNQTRYGGNSSLSSKEIREKAKATNLERYGTEVPSQNAEIKQKVKDTCIARYGSDYSKEFHKRCIKALKDKYGVEVNSAFGVPSVREKIQQSFQERYNRLAPNQTYSDEVYDILQNKDKLLEFIRNSENKTVSKMSKQLNITTCTLYKYINLYELGDEIDHSVSESSYEIEIKEILNKMGVEFKKDRTIIPPYEIDLYNDDLKIGIEFNGNFWHSEIYAKKNYHLEKSELAEKKGVFLYHIFEYEWNDERKQPIILSQLQNLIGINDNKVFARNCEIKNVSPSVANEFLENNHLQGKDISTIRLGLYHNGELVSLMTFCKPRFNKDYQWELSRFCNKCGYSVVGGASKLFKAFCKETEGTIISYSNIAKTKGTLYEKLGFKLDHLSTPNYVWWNTRNGELKTRYECQMKNESQIMQSQSFVRIYDCGNKVWVYKNLK